MKTLAARCAGIALLATSWSAHAFTIDSSTDVGDSFTVTWELLAGATDPNGNTNGTGYDITGEAVFVFQGFDYGADTITFDLTLTNTTAANDASIGLQKFGFATEPNATVSSWTPSGGGKIRRVENYTNSDSELDNAVSPGGASIIDVVTATRTGARRSLQAGESDTINLVLAFGDDLVAGSAVEFSPFAVKYQSDPDSFEFPASNGGGGGGGTTGVPVPGTLALLGIGALAARRRFRRLN